MYSALVCCKMGISGSASFHNERKSWYQRTRAKITAGGWLIQAFPYLSVSKPLSGISKLRVFAHRFTRAASLNLELTQAGRTIGVLTADAPATAPWIGVAR